MFSFAKTFITLAVVASNAVALSVNTPTGAVHSGRELKITWKSTPTDPIFTIELENPSFNSALALANNVDPSLDAITLTLPVVPAGKYTLKFVNIANINKVFTSSAVFSITPA